MLTLQTWELKNDRSAWQNQWESRIVHLSASPRRLYRWVPPHFASVSKSGRKCRPFISKTEGCQTTAAGSQTKSAVFQPPYSTHTRQTLEDTTIPGCMRSAGSEYNVSFWIIHHDVAHHRLNRHSVSAPMRDNNIYRYSCVRFETLHWAAFDSLLAGWKPVKDDFYACQFVIPCPRRADRCVSVFETVFDVRFDVRIKDDLHLTFYIQRFSPFQNGREVCIKLTTQPRKFFGWTYHSPSRNNSPARVFFLFQRSFEDGDGGLKWQHLRMRIAVLQPIAPAYS